jgi:hypothetical protein
MFLGPTKIKYFFVFVVDKEDKCDKIREKKE